MLVAVVTVGGGHFVGAAGWWGCACVLVKIGDFDGLVVQGNGAGGRYLLLHRSDVGATEWFSKTESSHHLGPTAWHGLPSRSPALHQHPSSLP